MGKVFEVLWRFALLGCASFGGPAAHMGYFRRTFVERLGWLDDERYANTVALSQFLPGPGSSQVGFAIGCHRAGLLGGLAAFTGFTLPSFVIMYFLAVWEPDGGEGTVFSGVVVGLKLLAVVVVADATLGMFSSFCKTRLTAGLCVATAAGLLLFPNIAVQLLALLAAALVGIFFIKREPAKKQEPKKAKVRKWPLAVFAILFLGLPLWPDGEGGLISLFAGFYQAGSLVFGGGHVVLPLLQNGAAESLGDDQFLVGYAAAQGVPGPMFTLATFLGAELTPEKALAGAAIATLGIFLPGFLLIYGFQGAWQSLAARPRLAGAVAGLNAAVVGLLLAAFFTPVFDNTIHNARDFALAVIGFYLLRGLKLPVLVLVALFIVAGIALR